jgi:hypothetical protein
MRQRGNDFGVIPRSFDDENNQCCRIAAASINCDFQARHFQATRRRSARSKTRQEQAG